MSLNGRITFTTFLLFTFVMRICPFQSGSNLPMVGELKHWKSEYINLIIILSYHGSKFSGWTSHLKNDQAPSNYPTSIHQYLTDTLLKLSGQKINLSSRKSFKLITSSRTDRGVSANFSACQVIGNFNSRIFQEPYSRLKYSLNSLLNKYLRIRAIIPSPSNSFNVRLHNIGKTYTYDYDLRSPGNPNNANCWIISKDKFLMNKQYKSYPNIDLKKMREASCLLTGTHDFRNFMGANNSSKRANSMNYTCTIDSVDIYTTPNKTMDSEVGADYEELERLRLRITGNRFLYKMIRNIASLLIQVGMCRITKHQIQNLLDYESFAKNLQYTAPAQGLTLQKVYFQKDLQKAIDSQIIKQNLNIRME